MIQFKTGLPFKTLLATNKDGVEQAFNVSTEEVEQLILSYIEAKGDGTDYEEEVAMYEAFDNEMKYYVPEVIFTSTTKDLVNFLNGIDDQEYK